MYDEILEHECGCCRHCEEDEKDSRMLEEDCGCGHEDCECGEDCGCGHDDCGCGENCECGEDDIDPFARPYEDFAKYVMVPDADGDEDIVSGSES